MIDKLKRRFLIIGTAFMFILMTVLVLIMNLVNFREVIAEADSVLDVLSQQGGQMPEGPFPEKQASPEPLEDFRRFMPRGMSPEVPYESRFFTATVSEDGVTVRFDLSRIVSVDEGSAGEYVEKALGSGSARGFIGDFRYSKTENGEGTRILFLDCGRKLDSFRSFLLISVIVGLGGCVAVFIAFILTAGRIVAPIAESYEKQKRFISDAGHEIKTPLTIINANVDLLETDGEKEELSDIRQQTERLTKLTNELILLSKMEEAEHTLQKIEFPLSDLVSETAGSFRAPAASRSLEIVSDITPDVTANGSPDAVRQLISILMDNAVKYSPDGGKISVGLERHKKSAVLSVRNTARDGMKDSDLSRIFDRFYRSDVSRNSGTGGHGIGLSIAKAITEAHGGTIGASVKDTNDFCVTVTLPL